MKNTIEKQRQHNYSMFSHPNEVNNVTKHLPHKEEDAADINSSDSLLQPKTSRFAITSMILGILGILTSTFTFFIPCILAIVIGHIARSEIKRSKGAITGNGMAIAGLMMGYLVPTSILVGPMIMKNISGSQI